MRRFLNFLSFFSDGKKADFQTILWKAAAYALAKTSLIAVIANRHQAEVKSFSSALQFYSIMPQGRDSPTSPFQLTVPTGTEQDWFSCLVDHGPLSSILGRKQLSPEILQEFSRCSKNFQVASSKRREKKPIIEQDSSVSGCKITSKVF